MANTLSRAARAVGAAPRRIGAVALGLVALLLMLLLLPFVADTAGAAPARPERSPGRPCTACRCSCQATYSLRDKQGFRKCCLPPPTNMSPSSTTSVPTNASIPEPMLPAKNLPGDTALPEIPRTLNKSASTDDKSLPRSMPTEEKAPKTANARRPEVTASAELSSTENRPSTKEGTLSKEHLPPQQSSPKEAQEQSPSAVKKLFLEENPLLKKNPLPEKISSTDDNLQLGKNPLPAANPQQRENRLRQDNRPSEENQSLQGSLRLKANPQLKQNLPQEVNSPPLANMSLKKDQSAVNRPDQLTVVFPAGRLLEEKKDPLAASARMTRSLSYYGDRERGGKNHSEGRIARPFPGHLRRSGTWVSSKDHTTSDHSRPPSSLTPARLHMTESVTDSHQQPQDLTMPQTGSSELPQQLPGQSQRLHQQASFSNYQRRQQRHQPNERPQEKPEQEREDQQYNTPQMPYIISYEELTPAPLLLNETTTKDLPLFHVEEIHLDLSTERIRFLEEVDREQELLLKNSSSEDYGIRIVDAEDPVEPDEWTTPQPVLWLEQVEAAADALESDERRLIGRNERAAPSATHYLDSARRREASKNEAPSRSI